MVLLALGFAAATQTSALDLSEGKMPALENPLVLTLAKRKNYQVGHSPFQLALLNGNPGTFKEGDAYAGTAWKRATPEERGFIFTANGSSPVYAEWTEPTDRKVLAQFMLGGAEISAYIVDGVMQPSNQMGVLPQQLTPLNLKAGRHHVIAGSGMRFLLYPVRSKFVFNPATAVISDVRAGESQLFEGSITAINCTDADQRLKLKAQIEDGPITETAVESLSAMNSRIVRFQYRAAPSLRAGSYKLKLWIEGDLPSVADIQVVTSGQAYRRTYIGSVDGAVHGYTVVPPSSGSAGKPVVSFTYGGTYEGSHVVAKEFKTPRDYSFVIPQFRGGSWSGLAGRDVMETLEQACRELRADRTRTYLFGHSMGGNGAYLLGSLNPKAFAGVGTSAGWISIFDYTGRERLNPFDPVEQIFDHVLQEQWVESRFDALASIKNFAVVHGTEDGSVPISHSKHLRFEMARRGAPFALFEIPGVAHFWEKDGMNQYDYPPVINKLLESPQRGTGQFMKGTKMPNTWSNGMTKRVAVVYGTRGNARENGDAFEKARREEAMLREFFRLESKAVADSVDPVSLRGWNVILIGNERTNALWGEHPSATLRLAEAKRRGVTVDGWLIQSPKGKDIWSVIGGETPRSAAAVYQLSQRWQTAAFPEWVLFDSTRLEDGFGWVVGAGLNGGPRGWRDAGNLTR
jgi:dienelactone hydrolase